MSRVPSLAVVEASTPPPRHAATDTFERRIDAAVVKIKASVPVSTLAVETAITIVLNGICLETCHYAIEGQELSKVFSLLFSGSANLAAGRTQKFVQL